MFNFNVRYILTFATLQSISARANIYKSVCTLCTLQRSIDQQLLSVFAPTMFVCWFLCVLLCTVWHMRWRCVISRQSQSSLRRPRLLWGLLESVSGANMWSRLVYSTSLSLCGTSFVWFLFHFFHPHFLNPVHNFWIRFTISESSSQFLSPVHGCKMEAASSLFIKASIAQSVYKLKCSRFCIYLVNVNILSN